MLWRDGSTGYSCAHVGFTVWTSKPACEPHKKVIMPIIWRVVGSQKFVWKPRNNNALTNTLTKKAESNWSTEAWKRIIHQIHMTLSQTLKASLICFWLPPSYVPYGRQVMNGADSDQLWHPRKEISCRWKCIKWVIHPCCSPCHDSCLMKVGAATLQRQRSCRQTGSYSNPTYATVAGCSSQCLVRHART